MIKPRQPPYDPYWLRGYRGLPSATPEGDPNGIRVRLMSVGATISQAQDVMRRQLDVLIDATRPGCLALRMVRLEDSIMDSAAQRFILEVEVTRAKVEAEEAVIVGGPGIQTAPVVRTIKIENPSANSGS